jgi:hypothetical protein
VPTLADRAVPLDAVPALVMDGPPSRLYFTPACRHTGAVRKHRAGVWVTTLSVLFVSLAGCSSAPVGSASSRPLPSPTPSAPGSGLPTPTDYGAACDLEPQVCTAPMSGKFPSAFDRPLALPSVPPGGSCPVSPTYALTSGPFAGRNTLGNGLVRAAVPDPIDGDVTHGFPDGLGVVNGWYGFKTLWLTMPSYQGPVLIRGGRIDAPGVLAFGEGPEVGELVIPPGDTLNESGGYRTAPGGTYFRTPGCYAWQVDGIGFSAVMVFRVTLR